MAASRSTALRDAGQPLTLASTHGEGDLKGQLVGLPIWQDAVCVVLNTDGGEGWAAEMAQGVKALTTMPDNPCLIPGTHKLEGGN